MCYCEMRDNERRHDQRNVDHTVPRKLFGGREDILFYVLKNSIVCKPLRAVPIDEYMSHSMYIKLILIRVIRMLHFD